MILSVIEKFATVDILVSGERRSAMFHPHRPRKWRPALPVHTLLLARIWRVWLGLDSNELDHHRLGRGRI